MPESKTELRTSKLEHVVRDWEATWGVRQRLHNWLLALRGWSITVVLAYLGFMTASDRDWTQSSFCSVWFPPALSIIAFFCLELSIRSQAYFFRDHILLIDDLFSKSSEEIADALKSHKFLGHREDEDKPKDRSRRCCRALKNPSMWLWYAMLLAGTAAVVRYWILAPNTSVG